MPSDNLLIEVVDLPNFVDLAKCSACFDTSHEFEIADARDDGPTPFLLRKTKGGFQRKSRSGLDDWRPESRRVLCVKCKAAYDLATAAR